MEIKETVYFCGEFVYRRLSALDWGIYFLSFEYKVKIFYARTNSEEHAADWVASLNSGRLTDDKIITSIESCLKNTEAAIKRNREHENNKRDSYKKHPLSI